MKRPFLWFAGLPALLFLAAGIAFIAYSLVLARTNGWALIPAMYPGTPWSGSIARTTGTLDLIAVLVGSAAINAAILFSVLAGAVALVRRLRS